MGKKKVLGLSATDKEMLDLLLSKKIEAVAEKMGVEKSAIYQRLYRIRKRRVQAQTFINQVNSYAQRDATLRKLLLARRVID